MYNSTELFPSERVKWTATSPTLYNFTGSAWTHWVVTWSPSDGASLYLDGQLVAQATTSQTTSDYMKDTMSIGNVHLLQCLLSCKKSHETANDIILKYRKSV